MEKPPNNLKRVIDSLGILRISSKISNEFPVVSFDVSTNVNGLEVTESTSGPNMSDKQLTIFKKARKGSKIYIEKVKVQKPGGIVVDIGSVNLKVI